MKSYYTLSSKWRDNSYLVCIIYRIAFILCVIMSTPSFAYNQYCDHSIEPGHVDLGYGKSGNSQLKTDTGAEVAITTSEANFAWPVNSEHDHSPSLSFNTLYTIMDFDTISPMTNGHLHTWGLSLSASYENSRSVISYQVTPTISVSSNALKNPGLMNSESLQLITNLVYKKIYQQNLAWVFGFMSDHRFGDYRLYPLAGVCWQPSEDWILQLTLPDFSISKNFSSGIHLTFYTAPEGNKWHVFSSDRQRNSELTYNSLVTGISAQWEITPAMEFSLDFEKQNSRKFSIVLDDNSLIEPTADSSMVLRLRGKFLF